MTDERLFFNNVNYIEIEISSLCNRECDYCPRSVCKRLRKLLPKNLFLKIIKELKQIEFEGGIAFHQYNEPLLEYEYLLWCIKTTAEMLPNVRLILYTNGDLLTKQKYRHLKKLGICDFHITCQLDKGEEWETQSAYQKVKKMKRKLGVHKGKIVKMDTEVSFLPFKINELRYNLKVYHLWNVKKYPVLTFIKSVNFYKAGSNRLNTVSNIVVEDKSNLKQNEIFCLSIIDNMNISYEGNAYLCWDCCEGIENDKKYCVGNIEDQTIFQLYRKKFEYVQKYLSLEGLECCKLCFWNNL